MLRGQQLFLHGVREGASLRLSNNFQKFNKVVRASHYMSGNVPSTFCELLYQYVYVLNVLRGDVINVTSYLCSWKNQDAGQILLQ